MLETYIRLFSMMVQSWWRPKHWQMASFSRHTRQLFALLFLISLFIVPSEMGGVVQLCELRLSTNTSTVGLSLHNIVRCTCTHRPIKNDESSFMNAE